MIHATFKGFSVKGYVLEIHDPFVFGKLISEITHEVRRLMNKNSNCYLDEEINTCPHYDVVDHKCKDSVKGCGMLNKQYVPYKGAYVRKPRWYEKYYRSGSFVS